MRSRPCGSAGVGQAMKVTSQTYLVPSTSNVTGVGVGERKLLSLGVPPRLAALCDPSVAHAIVSAHARGVGVGKDVFAVLAQRALAQQEGVHVKCKRYSRGGPWEHGGRCDGVLALACHSTIAETCLHQPGVGA